MGPRAVLDVVVKRKIPTVLTISGQIFKAK
jgi:hypothetical protein